jgi:peptide/nickel transport system substrate-binding protein
MTEDHLREMIGRVKRGTLSRRGFVRAWPPLGLTAPMATQLLAITGAAPAAAQSVPAYRRRGAAAAGRSRSSTGRPPPCSTRISPSAPPTRIRRASSTSRSPAGRRTARCTRSSPPRSRSRMAGCRRTALGHLEAEARREVARRPGLHRRRRVFNWEYARNPAVAAVTIGSYRDVNVVKVDDHTVRVEFAQPTPFWADAFVAATGMIIPKHLFGNFAGANSRDAPANLRPVGTGPIASSPSRRATLLRAELNPNYHMPTAPSSTRWRSRAAATRSRPRARCCRPATSTTPGTCRSRTRS